MPLRLCLGFGGEVCRRLSEGPRCPEHTKMFNRQRNARQDARRPSPTQRGLGSAHRRERAELIAAAEAQHGPLTHCPRCERAITPQNPLTGEHGVARIHGGMEITALCCRSCNSSMGATLRRLKRQD